MNTEDTLRRERLDALLAESNPRQAGELLVQHGPIIAAEVPYLTQKAESGSATARANAARYLGLARAPEATVALRALAAKTEDLAVFAFALGALLDESDAKTLAAARPELVRKALHHPDPEVAAIGIRAAWLAGLSGVADDLAAKLNSTNDKERQAVLEVLAKAGAGPLEPKLIELLNNPNPQQFTPFSLIYQALCHSDNPAAGEALRKSLADGNRDHERDFSNAVFLSKSRKPWLRALLLSLAHSDGSLRWTALDRLGEWGEPALTRELVQICLTEYEKRLPKERSATRNTDSQLDECDRYMGTLAGRQFLLDARYDAMEFARSWLAAHPG